MDHSPESSALAAIAVVGISAELPSGKHSEVNLDFSTFQDLLLQGKDVYETFPNDRINIQSWKGRGLGQILPDTGAFLKDLALFDHLEFSVSAKDARAMAVGTRKLLEQSFLALLDSGIDYRNRNIGCFMSAVDFDISNIVEPDEFEARGSFAGSPCMVANRISYYLDLLGPSIPVDTACSSSLTATHLAVQAIRNGDCEAAIVGGCQVNHRLLDWINYSQASVLSPDGKCKPFDASANGFGRGEGTVVVVLKPLDDAIRDGDHIYASILGTGINSCGGVAPVSAPVAEAQKNAMVRAYRRTGRLPTEVDYVELHATGTAAGDPTEANWVGETFKRDEVLLVGSVKGNIGHLEITAFLASLLKACSAFASGLIPPSISFHEPNPAIKWAEHNMGVVTKATPLLSRHSSGKSLISITSSGIGGSNGHAVLEGPPFSQSQKNSAHSQIDRLPILLLAAGLTPRSAAAYSEALAEFIISSQQPGAHLSTILGRRARQLTWRSFAVVSAGQISNPLEFSAPTLVPRERPPLVFLFSGQGPQHIHMGRQLFSYYPVFRETILSLDVIYEQSLGHSFVKTTGLFDTFDETKNMPMIWPISVVLPALVMVQIAMVDLLRSFNIVPDIVLGHSAGETAVLYACGAVSKETAFSVSIGRGRAMSQMEEVGGTMAALSCNQRDAQAIIEAVSDGKPDGRIEIACFNAPEAIAIAGFETAIGMACSRAKDNGFYATTLRTRVPVHSSLMDICKDRYQSLVTEVFKACSDDCRPKIKTYSTLTGEQWTIPFTPDYFWDNARGPVRFTDTVTNLLHETPNATFIEIGPHPVLSAYVTQLGASPMSVFSVMQRSKHMSDDHEPRVLLECIGKLVTRGLAVVDFASLNNVKGEDLKSTNDKVPPYPLNRRHIPYQPDFSSLAARQLRLRNGPLSDPELKMSSMTHPDIAQHVIKGVPIMPAAGYLEMAFQRGARQLWKIDFHSMLSLSSNYPVAVQFEIDGLHWTVGSQSGTREADRYHLHTEGYLSKSFVEEPLEGSSLDIRSITDRCRKIETDDFYRSLTFFADYGPAYQRIMACYKGSDEALAQISGNPAGLENYNLYILHPAILDSCFHVIVHKILTLDVDDNNYYLPSHVDNVYLYDRLIKKGTPDVLYVHAVFRQWCPGCLKFDLTIVDSDGFLLCSLLGFEISKHKSTLENGVQRRFDVVNELATSVMLSNPTGPAKVDSNPPLLLQFHRGGEMEFKRKIQEMDRSIPCVVWIFASLDDEGAAARGFSRSLRREIPSWNIRLVLLPEWNMEMQKATVHQLSDLGLSEPEIIICANGDIFYPRIVLSSAPSSRSFDESSLWHLNDNGQIVQSDSVKIADTYTLVSVELMSMPSGTSLRGFIGRVLKGKRTGKKVIGVIGDHPLSNFALVHEDCIAPIENDRLTSPNLAIGALAVSVALGTTNIARLSSMSGKRVLVTNSSSPVGSGSCHILTALGIAHDSVDIDIPIVAVYGRPYDIAISGFTRKDDIQILRSWMQSSSNVFFWNDSMCGLQAVVKKHIWAIADALCLYNALDIVSPGDGVSPKVALELAVDMTSVEIFKRLFDPSKMYLLVGGIGSLGIAIAVWMYKQGARHLVMTSRNGVKSSSLVSNVTALRMLAHA